MNYLKLGDLGAGFMIIFFPYRTWFTGSVLPGALLQTPSHPHHQTKHRQGQTQNKLFKLNYVQSRVCTK